MLSQIDDIPVLEVQDILNDKDCTVSVKRLVIPVDIQVNIQGIYEGTSFITNTENTTLYFLDQEENVGKFFYVEGQSSNNPEAVYFQAAYYGGQWDYVDGIPTPNK